MGALSWFLRSTWCHDGAEVAEFWFVGWWYQIGWYTYMHMHICIYYVLRPLKNLLVSLSIFLYIYIYISIIHNQISIYVNRRGNKRHRMSNPPAPKVLGRDLPDGTRKRLQVYLGGGIFRPKPPVFDRSWRSPSKNTVKNSTEDTCSWTRPSKIGKRKVKKPPCFSTFWLQFVGLQHLFLRFRRWPGPEADFWVFGPVFGLIFVVLW